MVADIPGALVCCCLLLLMSRVANSRRALLTMLGLMIAGLAALLLLTAAFQHGALPGAAWLVLYSTFFYVPLGLSNTPVFERLFAATRAPGTCTFLVFTADFYGYVATISLLLFQSFGPLGGSSDAAVLSLYTGIIWAGVPPFAALLLASLLYFAWRLPKLERPALAGGADRAGSPEDSTSGEARADQVQPKVN